MSVSTEVSIFWDMTPCNFYIGINVSDEHASRSLFPIVFVHSPATCPPFQLPVKFPPITYYVPSLNMEALFSFEALVSTY
jgi:hypothetical protein